MEEGKEEQRKKDIESVVKFIVRDVEKTKQLNGYYFYLNH